MIITDALTTNPAVTLPLWILLIVVHASMYVSMYHKLTQELQAVAIMFAAIFGVVVNGLFFAIESLPALMLVIEIMFSYFLVDKLVAVSSCIRGVGSSASAK